MHESGEMYLETILILSKRNAAVRSIDVADEMHFSKPSVSRGLSKLKSENYILVDESGHITLTETGLAIASKIYERHEVLSEVLVRLGVSPIIAVQDACKIEHDISDETFEALKKHVNNLNL